MNSCLSKGIGNTVNGYCPRLCIDSQRCKADIGCADAIGYCLGDAIDIAIIAVGYG